MRLRLFLISLAMLGAILAEEKKDGLIERSNAIPDPNRINPMQDIEFKNTSPLLLVPARIGDRRAGEPMERQFQSSEFVWTRSFLGINNPWFGSRTLVLRDAAIPVRGGLPRVTRVYPTGELAGVQPGRDAGKVAVTGGDVVAPRAFPVRGKAQGSLDAEHANVSKKMTVEEVRELLNRNR